MGGGVEPASANLQSGPDPPLQIGSLGPSGDLNCFKSTGRRANKSGAFEEVSIQAQDSRRPFLTQPVFLYATKASLRDTGDGPFPLKHGTVRAEPDMPQKFQLVFDCAGPTTLANFYGNALGYKLEDPPSEFSLWEDALKARGVPEADWGQASAIVELNEGGPRMYFQRMDTPEPKKNRLHLDVNTTVGSRLPVSERKIRYRRGRASGSNRSYQRR